MSTSLCFKCLAKNQFKAGVRRGRTIVLQLHFLDRALCTDLKKIVGYDHVAKWTFNDFPDYEADDFRYRLLLNDGVYSNSFSMLATQVRF